MASLRHDETNDLRGGSVTRAVRDELSLIDSKSHRRIPTARRERRAANVPAGIIA
jgi:hypothetical protein